LAVKPLSDDLNNEKGGKVKLDVPSGHELPAKGFAVEDAGYQAPAENGSSVTVKVDPASSRLQLLQPFEAWNGRNITGSKFLIKTNGKIIFRP